MNYIEIVDELKNFFKMDFALKNKEKDYRKFLTDESCEEKGILIKDLYLIAQSYGSVELGFAENYAKFKPGSYLILESACRDDNFNVIVKDIAGQSLSLAEGYRTNFPDFRHDEKFRLFEDVFIEPSYMFHTISELHRRDYCKRFLDIFFDPDFVSCQKANNYESEFDDYLARKNFVPHITQRDLMLKCVSEPEVLAVKGPPGTGKTTMLAHVANFLNSLGKNVFIVTNNHVALNNALNEIYKINPNSNLVKFGQQNNKLNLNESIEIVTNDIIMPGMDTGIIVGMTIFGLLKSYRYPIKAKTPDVIIVDEASQLPFHIAIGIGAINAKSVLFFGDEKQMPPIYNEELAPHPFAKSIFELFVTIHPELTGCLEETHRMNETLTKVVESKTYEVNGHGFLISGAANAKRTLSLSFGWEDSKYTEILKPDNSFVWIETPINFSRQINNVEASLCADILVEFVKYGVKSKDICVVTPFKRQANLIYQYLKSLADFNFDLPIIDTVERIQGQSVEIVIISYVASDPDYLTDISNFIFSKNRLNVAISRAKTKVVFMCSDAILNILPNTYKNLENQNYLRDKKEKAKLVKI